MHPATLLASSFNNLNIPLIFNPLDTDAHYRPFCCHRVWYKIGEMRNGRVKVFFYTHEMLTFDWTSATTYYISRQPRCSLAYPTGYRVAKMTSGRCPTPINAFPPLVNWPHGFIDLVHAGGGVCDACNLSTLFIVLELVCIIWRLPFPWCSGSSSTEIMMHPYNDLGSSESRQLVFKAVWFVSSQNQVFMFVCFAIKRRSS